METRLETNLEAGLEGYAKSCLEGYSSSRLEGMFDQIFYNVKYGKLSSIRSHKKKTRQTIGRWCCYRNQKCQ